MTVDLNAVRKGVGELQSSISETAQALDGIKQAAKSRSDLKASYGAFDSQYKKLQKQIETLRAQATQMRTRAAEHYKAWQSELSQMGNPKLREKALNRYEEAKEEFDEIIVIADHAKRELEPFLADLRDVNSYLSADLSADAVKSLSNDIWKLGNKSRAVVASLQHLNGQIGKAMEAQPENK